MYSILKINTYGGSTQFKLHNKNDGRAFSNVKSKSMNYSENEFRPDPSPLHAFSQTIPDLVQENVYSTNKEDSGTILEQLEKFGKLRESGILTDTEFAEQKKKLLDKL
ncbi:SHOCT domain-containing protein [Chryseobacterium sp. MEBOG07]|uniref:SHOCT domain-containing protein n=1 Tax=Chryseobacterium sp. MEBOG07 TaxID=2879939 RepID=UPI001F3979C2|nr:SHOCT domain-containing protein [Chryseobacterium sp. MEBOG07]UKB81643.1 SHOCT domain-containing protein [Chryseobacterium sp. MEBOG07]